MDIRSTLFLSLLAAGAVAHAEGFYVLGSGGITGTSLNDTSKSKQDAVYVDPYANASSKLDRSDTGYKLQAGYQFAPNFALEGGYVDLGKIEYKYTNPNGSGNFSYDNKGFNLDGVLILPVNAGVSVFGKLGLIYAETKLKGTGIASETKKETCPTFGAGVAWNFYAGLSARAEWERFFDLNNKNSTNTSMDVDLFSVGLSYQF